MARPKKITWTVVFQDFKLRYPNQAKMALGFEPYDYATIKVKLPNNTYVIYNYDTKQVSNI